MAGPEAHKPVKHPPFGSFPPHHPGPGLGKQALGQLQDALGLRQVTDSGSGPTPVLVGENLRAGSLAPHTHISGNADHVTKLPLPQRTSYPGFQSTGGLCLPNVPPSWEILCHSAPRLPGDPLPRHLHRQLPTHRHPIPGTLVHKLLQDLLVAFTSLRHPGDRLAPPSSRKPCT